MKTTLKKVKMKTSLRKLRSNSHQKTWNCKRAHIFLSFKNYFEGSPLQSCELPSKGLLAPLQRECGPQIDCCRNPGEVNFLILIKLFEGQLVLYKVVAICGFGLLRISGLISGLPIFCDISLDRLR